MRYKDSAEFNDNQKRIKEIESRQKDISTLQKQIGSYGKIKETYNQYIKSGRDKDFYESQRADITLHIAAIKYFDELGYSRNNKLPTINALRQEWAALESEKKSLYRGYRERKNQHIELLKARDNTERLLGINQRSSENKNHRDIRAR